MIAFFSFMKEIIFELDQNAFEKTYAKIKNDAIEIQAKYLPDNVTLKDIRFIASELAHEIRSYLYTYQKE